MSVYNFTEILLPIPSIDSKINDFDSKIYFNDELIISSSFLSTKDGIELLPKLDSVNPTENLVICLVDNDLKTTEKYKLYNNGVDILIYDIEELEPLIKRHKRKREQRTFETIYLYDGKIVVDGKECSFGRRSMDVIERLVKSESVPVNYQKLETIDENTDLDKLQQRVLVKICYIRKRLRAAGIDNLIISYRTKNGAVYAINPDYKVYEVRDSGQVGVVDSSRASLSIITK